MNGPGAAEDGRRIGARRPAAVGGAAAALARRWLAVFAIALAFGPSPAPATDSAKPDIIVVMTDDQRFDTTRWMPVLQSRIAARGTSFTNSFVTTPACCPSRSSFLTGLYAHDHGIWRNGNGAPRFRASGWEAQSLGVRLQALGYQTALMGKYLNSYDGAWVPEGWNRWVSFVHEPGYYRYQLKIDDSIRSFGSADADYSTDVLADLAASFVRTAKEPFFLFFTPKNPHTPLKQATAHRHAGTCADVPEKYRDPVCSVKSVDEAIGRILDALGSRSTNTVVIFTSDNGYLLGEHGKRGKGTFYDEALRVPLVVAVPGGPAQQRTELVTNLDVSATVLAYAGSAYRGEGASLAPILAGEHPDWQTSILFEWQDKSGKNYGVRTARYKYVEFADRTRKLFDLAADPAENTDVIGDPAQAGAADALRSDLARLKAAAPAARPR